MNQSSAKVSEELATQESAVPSGFTIVIPEPKISAPGISFLVSSDNEIILGTISAPTVFGNALYINIPFPFQPLRATHLPSFKASIAKPLVRIFLVVEVPHRF